MKPFFRCCLNQTMRKYIDESGLAVRKIVLQKGDLSYFNLSSNPIISFIYDGKLLYFRECPQQLSFRAYYKKYIDCFFATLGNLYIPQEHFKQQIPIRLQFSSTEIEDFYNYLNNKLQNRQFWKRIAQIDRISMKLNFSIWEPQCYEEEFFCSFSLGDIPKQCYDIGIYFLWYMRGVCTTYRTLNIAKGKRYSYFSAVKSVASQIVAESVGLGHMITTAEFCRIEFENKNELFGVISSAAEGNRMLDADRQINGALQKELLNLNILDIICFQTDHGMNNYNVCEKEGKYTVCAFDNDNPNTFLPVPFIKYNFLGCSSLVDKRGALNRPYFSEELFRNIQNLDIRSLKRKLNPYLNSLQILALLYRINKIRRMLEKTKKHDPNILIADDQWNDKTVRAESDEKYRKTYFTMLLNVKQYIVENNDYNERPANKSQALK